MLKDFKKVSNKLEVVRKIKIKETHDPAHSSSKQYEEEPAGINCFMYLSRLFKGELFFILFFSSFQIKLLFQTEHEMFII